MSASAPARGKKQKTNATQTHVSGVIKEVTVLSTLIIISGFRPTLLIKLTRKLQKSMSKAALELTHLGVLRYLTASQPHLLLHLFSPSS